MKEITNNGVSYVGKPRVIFSYEKYTEKSDKSGQVLLAGISLVVILAGIIQFLA